MMMIESSTLSYISHRKSKRRGAVDPVLNLPQGLVKTALSMLLRFFLLRLPFFLLNEAETRTAGKLQQEFHFSLL